MANDDPTYEELIEENYELHEEVKALTSQVRLLEDLSQRRTGIEDEQRASEIESLQRNLARAQGDARDHKVEVEQLRGERDAWERKLMHLETALRDKEDRYYCRQTGHLPNRLFYRLSSVLQGQKNATPGRVHQAGNHLDYEQNLLEADQENEHIRAELSTLESQVSVLQGALAVLPVPRWLPRTPYISRQQPQRGMRSSLFVIDLMWLWSSQTLI